MPLNQSKIILIMGMQDCYCGEAPEIAFFSGAAVQSHVRILKTIRILDFCIFM